MDGANEAALASIVRTPVVMNLNRGCQAQPLHKWLAVEERVEVNPDMRSSGPRPANRNDLRSVSEDVLFRILQVFAYPRLAIKLLQAIFTTRAPIKYG